MTKKEKRKPEKWFIQEYFNRNIAYIVIKDLKDNPNVVLVLFCLGIL